MTTHNSSIEAGAVICAGLFFVVSGEQATAHIVCEDDMRDVYTRLALAAQACNPVRAMQQATQMAFRVKDADFAIAAPNKKKLEELMTTYNEQARDAVRVLAARWLAGLPFTSLDDEGSGATDRIPEPPTIPPTPAGANEPESLKPQLETTLQDTTPAITLDSLLALASR